MAVVFLLMHGGPVYPIAGGGLHGDYTSDVVEDLIALYTPVIVKA